MFYPTIAIFVNLTETRKHQSRHSEETGNWFKVFLGVAESKTLLKNPRKSQTTTMWE